MAIAQESQIRAEQAQTSLKVEATFIRPGLVIPSIPKALVGPNMPFSQYLSIHEPNPDQGTTVSLYAAKEPETDAKAFQKRVGRSVGIQEQMKRISIQLQKLDVDTSQLAANGQVRKQNEKDKAALRNSLTKQIDALRHKLLTNDFNHLGSTTIAQGFDPAGTKAASWMKEQIEGTMVDPTPQHNPVNSSETTLAYGAAMSAAVGLMRDTKKLKREKEKKDEKNKLRRKVLPTSILAGVGYLINSVTGNPVGKVFEPPTVQAAESGVATHNLVVPIRPGMQTDEGGGGGGHIYPPRTGTPPATAEQPQPTATTEATKAPPATATAKPPTPEPTKVANLSEQEILNKFLETSGQTQIIQYSRVLGITPGTPKEITQRLESEGIVEYYIGKDNTNFGILRDPQTKAPLFIYENGSWKNLYRNDLGNKTGMLLGLSAVEWYANQTPQYMLNSLNDANHFQIDDFVMWNVLEQKQGVLNQKELGKIATFMSTALDKGKTLSAGSGLIMGSADFLPTWLVRGNFSQDQLIQIAEKHLEDFLGPYKNNFKRVAVANEMMPHDLGKANFWTETNHIDRKEFLKDLYHKARLIVPNAELTLRDFSVEFAGYQKADDFYNLVKELNDEEMRVGNRKLIDGVELQMPLMLPELIGKNPAMNPNNFTDSNNRAQMMEKFRENIRRFKAIGVNVYVTELFVPIDNLPGDQAQKLSLQADIYNDIYSVCIEEGVGVTLFRVDSDPNPNFAYPDPKKNTLPYTRDVDGIFLPSYFAVENALLNSLSNNVASASTNN